MSEGIKDKALRYRNLSNDETFKEIIENVAQRQIDVFLSRDSSDEEIDNARKVVLALKQIENEIQTVFDAEAVFDKKHNL
jgi:formylmethanofuran dehydrogenase subunit E-like metal-binding protein